MTSSHDRGLIFLMSASWMFALQKVLCADASERASWVNDIRAAITFEVERKMKLEAARLAVITKAF